MPYDGVAPIQRVGEALVFTSVFPNGNSEGLIRAEISLEAVIGEQPWGLNGSPKDLFTKYSEEPTQFFPRNNFPNRSRRHVSDRQSLIATCASHSRMPVRFTAYMDERGGVGRTSFTASGYTYQ